MNSYFEKLLINYVSFLDRMICRYHYLFFIPKNRASRNRDFMVLLLLTSLVFGSCSKQIKPKEGQIDLLCSIYPEASKGLEAGETFLLSSLYFSSDGILERADGGAAEKERWSWVEKEKYSLLLKEKDLFTTIEEKKSVYEKAYGAPFHKGLPLNFDKRKILSDTLLFRKKLERFELASKESYARYYLYRSDTLLPYGLYRDLEKKLGARVERIEAYDPKEDVLVTLQLFYRSKVEEEMKKTKDQLSL